MSRDAIILFLSLLTVGSQVFVVAYVLLRAGGRTAVVDDAFGPNAAALALLVAVVAVAGSLYFSEVAHFRPCKLCWYQRAVMYPLVPILAVALWRRWTNAWRFVVPMTLVGASISTWHVLVERYPTLEASACDPTNPCSLIWFKRFGYITIPTMALSGFLLIATLMLIGRQRAAAESR